MCYNNLKLRSKIAFLLWEIAKQNLGTGRVKGWQIRRPKVKVYPSGVSYFFAKFQYCAVSYKMYYLYICNNKIMLIKQHM